MRPRNLIGLAAIYLGCALFLTAVTPAFAISYQTLLKTGDTASYALYYRSDPALGDQMKVLGVSTSGNVVTANFQDYPSYGIFLGTTQLNIFSGQTNSSVPTLYFAVAPGLIIGDPIYDGSSYSITAQQNYSCGTGQSRQQVYTRITNPDHSQTIQISWDQTTGLMCNYQANYVSNNTVALGLILAGTTVWGSTNSGLDPFVYGQVLPSLFGLVLVVLVLYIYFGRRKRARPRSRTN